MSNYVKSTNFASKDTLPLGDPLKIVKGTEIDTEFNNIATAVGTKADLASPAFTGVPAAPTASPGTNTTQLATTAFVTAVTSTLGTMSTQAANNVAITGGSITGITDLAIADGGTGASDAATARSNLGANDAANITTGNLAAARITNALNATGSAPIYACRAWVNFDGTTTTPSIRASGNVSSITDNGTGDYTVNFTTAMPDVNYDILTNGGARTLNTLGAVFPNLIAGGATTRQAPTTGGFRVAVQNFAATTFDDEYINLAVFR